MNNFRVVLDTNILISGLLLSSAKPQQVFDIVTEHHTLLMSEAVLAEILQTFTRPKFDRYLALEKRLAFFASLQLRAKTIAIRESIDACRDPKDNKFLELAVNGEANLLITGDQDLLVLNPFRSVEIITAADFLNRMGKLA